MGTSASPAGRDEVSGSDQRQSVRKVVSKPIAIELQPGREVWIRDLGEGGLSVSGSSPLELGTNAIVRFELPEADSVIDASGVITWSDESGRAGVRFTQVEPDSTAALRRWLNSGPSAHTSQSDAPLYDNDLASKVACLREVADLQAIIASEHLETPAALDLIVRRMAELTRATGAAIALREGQDVFCRASFGNAPDIGVKLSPNSLSGECLRSGAMVMLEDSEDDPRVNPELCRQLNFRSLLVLPVTSGTEIVGIAEVLSPDLRNFEAGDVLVISFLTDLIASLPTAPTETPATAPTETAVPDLSDLLKLQVFEPLPTQSSAKDLAPAVSMAASQKISRSLPASAFAVKQSAPARERHRDVEKSIPIRIPARSLGISVVAILLGMAVVLLGYYFRQSFTSNKPNNISSAVSSVNASAKLSEPAVPVSTQATSSNSGTESKRIVRPNPAPVTRARESAVTELDVIQGHTMSVTPGPESAAPEPVTMTALDAPRGPSSLPASVIATNTPVPTLSPTQSQGVTPGKLIKRVVPQYPDMARRAGVSGDVVLTGIIRTDGILRNLKVVSGSPLLRDAALDAAKQWRYSPYLLGGKPVEAETHITIAFHQ